MNTSARTSSARSAGQSQNGGNDALAGMPTRTAATFDKCRRCTTALMKCVVPITIASTWMPAMSGCRVRRDNAATIPPVTSSVVGTLTACMTRASSSSTASVLVPPTSMPMRLMVSGAAPGSDGKASPQSRKHRVELDVVAERAWPDMLQSLRRQEHGGRGQCDHRHPHAIADRLGAEGVAADRVEYANQIGRHRDRGAVPPGDHPFVLEREFEPAAPVVVEAFDRCGAAQEPFGRTSGDVD